jgi:hypothetical protein
MTVFICSWLPCTVLAQLPPGAAVSKEIEARFGPRLALVAFYQTRNRTVGFEIMSPQGEGLAGDQVEATTLLDQTGVYDATGTGQPDIVLHSGVGQASELQIYAFSAGKLRKLFSWSGATSQIIHLRGRPVLALTAAPYGTLTDLFAWEGGAFKEVNAEFPEFYSGEIRDQGWFIEDTQPFTASQYSRACALAAQGLIYQKRYDEARRVCKEADDLVASGQRIVPSQVGEPEEEVARERAQAQAAIRQTLESIAVAEQHGPLH